MRGATVLGLVLSFCLATATHAALLPAPHVTSVNAAGRPTFIEGRLARIGSPVDQRAVERVAEQLAPLFRIDAGTMELQRIKRDDLGVTHARFRQVAYGIEVVGGDFLVHVDRDGVVFAASSAARDRALPLPAANIDAATAVRKALEARPGEAGDPHLKYVITTRDQSLYLAWEIIVSGSDAEGPFRDAIYVEACGGSIVEVRPLVHRLLQRRIYSLAYDFYLPGAILRTEGGAPSNDPVANADYDHWGRVYQCFETLFNRSSYDDHGATIVSSIHFGFRNNNAAWNGQQFWFGDGDGVEFSNLAWAYDVHAHEFMHAVTQYESQLAYLNEPGAVNESLSDVMAATCEQLFPPAAAFQPVDPWAILETVYTPAIDGDAYRYMTSPTLDGESKDYYPERYIGIDDNGGVHWNSGIGNLAFYLLAVGGKHPRGKTTFSVAGIGIVNAAKIFYRSNDYLPSGARFSDFRSATITAASSLNMTASVIDAVKTAWAAVGVGDAPPPPPQPIVLPAAPSSLTAKATALGQIDLTWQDNSTAESGFKIERRSGASAYTEIDRVATNVTAYSNRGLAPLTNYFYRVRAYNGNGSSAYSNEAEATTPGTNAGAPIAPGNLRGTATTSFSIELAWVHEGNDEKGFIVERGTRSTSMAEVKRVGANVTSYVDTGLTDRVTYLYRVRAYNANGVSQPSNQIEVQTLADQQGCCSFHNGVCDCDGSRVICCDQTLSPTCKCESLRPNSPVHLTARGNSINNIFLTWLDTSSNETHFVIERAKNGPFSVIGSAGANSGSFTDTSAGHFSATRYDQPTGTMVSYRVRSCKANLCSEPSNVVSMATDCRGTMLPTGIDFSPAGGWGIYTISVFGGCKWGVQSHAPDWVRLRNDGGTGTGTVEYDVLPNTGPPRTGYIIGQTGHALMVGFLIHEVRQGGTVLPAPAALTVAIVGSEGQLTWESVATNVPFVVERRDVCEDSFTPIASTERTGYIDASRVSGVDYVYRVRAVGSGLESEYSNLAPPQGVGASCGGGAIATSTLAARPATTAASALLASLIPASLPSTTRRANPPRNVIGTTNAVEAIGFDYVSNATGRNAAAITAFRSTGGVYENDYGVWARYREGRLTRVEPVALRPASENVWFWRARIERDDSAVEWGMTFALFVDATGFTVDSQWIRDAYPGDHAGDVLTFHVWSDDEETTARLVLEILGNVADRGAVTYDNRREPPGTLVFASHAAYEEPNIVLGITNASESPRDLTFTIAGRSTAAETPQQRHVFSETVPPGQTTIKLPMPGIVSAFVHVDDGADFIDSVFVSDGRWIASGSGATDDASRCTAAETLIAVDRHVAGCASVRGAEPAGFTRTLDAPGRRDADVSRWQAVTFFARGNQKSYRFRIETDGTRVAGTPPHEVTFTAPPEGRQLVIPLRAFGQPFNPDVRLLSWSGIDQDVDLFVDHVAFTSSVVISQTNAVRNRVSTRVTDEVEVAAVTLVYRIGGAGPFTRIPMSASDGDPALWVATIPATATGSQISYYIEATDDSGNVATDPFDAPFATHRHIAGGGRGRAVRK